jgi:hypothetical protein
VTDDERPDADEIVLGREPRPSARIRLAALASRLRERWLPRPAMALTSCAVILVIASVIAALVIRDHGGSQPAAARSPAEDSAGVVDVPTPTVTESTPAISLPQGLPPAVPYYADGVLRWPAGEAHRPQLRLHNLVSAHGVSLALTRSQEMLLLDGPRPTTVGIGVTSGPAISPDAALAAWTRVGHLRNTMLVAWDLNVGHEEASQSLELDFPCCDEPGIQVVGVDADDRVYLTAGTHSLVWNPSSRSVSEITGLGGLASLVSVTPQGPVFVGPAPLGTRVDSTYGVVDADGQFTPAGRVRGTGGSWSPSGDIVARLPSPRIAIAQPLKGVPTRLKTPASTRLSSIMWESNATVLVVATDSDRYSTWLRCDAGSGLCEVAADLGVSGRGGLGWSVSSNLPDR